MAQPVRRCAGCGRRSPQSELVRFVAVDGELVRRDAVSPGRSAYTCRRLACFERATAQRGFARVLHTPVRVDPALARIYTGESHG
ncbi:MAG: YlxR family protein [Acidobacteriota bacterium]|nr:YlxR family protein [Acidobacteriota bacterium]MDE3191856.1 YlxR family protein [Acidobacteriota bacterium]